jgi:hypothetical protein
MKITIERRSLAATGLRVYQVYLLAFVFAMGLFFLHIVLLFDVAGFLVRSRSWLEALFGQHHAGKTVILACFFVLFFAHLAEAAAWGCSCAGWGWSLPSAMVCTSPPRPSAPWATVTSSCSHLGASSDP